MCYWDNFPFSNVILKNTNFLEQHFHCACPLQSKWNIFSVKNKCVGSRHATATINCRRINYETYTLVQTCSQISPENKHQHEFRISKMLLIFSFLCTHSKRYIWGCNSFPSIEQNKVLMYTGYVCDVCLFFPSFPHQSTVRVISSRTVFVQFL